jgi:hypothetical protein
VGAWLCVVLGLVLLLGFGYNFLRPPSYLRK